MNKLCVTGVVKSSSGSQEFYMPLKKFSALTNIQTLIYYYDYGNNIKEGMEMKERRMIEKIASKKVVW